VPLLKVARQICRVTFNGGGAYGYGMTEHTALGHEKNQEDGKTEYKRLKVDIFIIDGTD
jgi:hypothetical protein